MINLTIHEITPEQAEAGVVEPQSKIKEEIKQNLLFEQLPDKEAISARAKNLAEIAERHGVSAAMIGGAPYLMPELEDQLRQRGIVPAYAYSTRESVEEKQEDGSIAKRNVFRHKGFIYK